MFWQCFYQIVWVDGGYNVVWVWYFEDMVFDFVDYVYFVWMVVKFQGQDFIVMDQLYWCGFLVFDGVFCLFWVEVEGELQIMFSDYYWYIVFFFVCFIGGVDQLYVIVLVECLCFVVIDVGEEGEMGFWVDWWWYGDWFVGVMLSGVEVCFIQYFCSFLMQLVEQVVGYKQWWQINLYFVCIVDGLFQFCDIVMQVG